MPLTEDANWKVCVPNCFYDGNNIKVTIVQCHICKSWIHPECVGQTDSDIVGIWTCPTCRTLPVLVQRLLDRSSRAGGDDGSPRGIEQATHCPRRRATTGYERTSRRDVVSEHVHDDVVRASRGVTLLVGNSLVRDIDVMRTAEGVSTNVRSKSGASFADIGDMIEEAANHDDFNSIVVVSGTKEAMGKVSNDDFKERTQLLITKAKTVAEAVTVGHSDF